MIKYKVTSHPDTGFNSLTRINTRRFQIGDEWSLLGIILASFIIVGTAIFVPLTFLSSWWYLFGSIPFTLAFLIVLGITFIDGIIWPFKKAEEVLRFTPRYTNILQKNFDNQLYFAAVETYWDERKALGQDFQSENWKKQFDSMNQDLDRVRAIEKNAKIKSYPDPPDFASQMTTYRESLQSMIE